MNSLKLSPMIMMILFIVEYYKTFFLEKNKSVYHIYPKYLGLLTSYHTCRIWILKTVVKMEMINISILTTVLSFHTDIFLFSSAFNPCPAE